MVASLEPFLPLLLVAGLVVGAVSGEEQFDPDCPDGPPGGDVDPDHPCAPQSRTTSTPPPPGPAVVLYGEPGQDITFHCVARSPCARLVVNDTEGARSYVMVQSGDGLVGSYGVDAHGLLDVPRDQWSMQCEQDHWCLSGNGLAGNAGTVQSAGQVPVGLATSWHFTFSLMSGMPAGDLTVRIVFSDGPAPVPWWAPDGQCIPCD